MALCILPAGAIARRYGRRTAFLAGTGCGVLTGLLAAGAVVLGSFASGSLLATYGWYVVLWVSFVPLILAVIALALTAMRRVPSSGHSCRTG